LPENVQRELTKRGEENHTKVIVFKDKSHWITFKADKGLYFFWRMQLTLWQNMVICFIIDSNFHKTFKLNKISAKQQ
jgi:hypothetical protein